MSQKGWLPQSGCWLAGPLALADISCQICVWLQAPQPDYRTLCNPAYRDSIIVLLIVLQTSWNGGVLIENLGTLPTPRTMTILSGPRSQVCAPETIRSAPHRHERKFSCTSVCRVTFKHLPQKSYLKFHNPRTTFENTSLCAQNCHSARGREGHRIFWALES